MAQDFTARLKELTAELRFFHKPDGQQVPPQVIMTQLPLHSRSHMEGDDFPLICWTHYQGELSHLQPRGFDVVIDCGLLVDETEGTPLQQIERGTLAALHPLAGSRKFGKWKLQLPFTY